MMVVYSLYFVVLFFLSLFSYGFVDANFPFVPLPFIRQFIYEHRATSTVTYLFILTFLFFFYKKNIRPRQIATIIAVVVVTLFFSYPAFSYDIFNYIATAKVAYFYGENPYIIMPIDIANEPLLAFMHAANKTALYGPVWIGLTAIPHFIGGGNILFTIAAFKLLTTFFYLLLILLIWKISQKNLSNVVFFALNPLVMIETLVSSHNDVVMMFFALLSFYLLTKKRLLLATVALLCSILIKYATIILVPVYFYLVIKHYQRKAVDWQKIWRISALLMFVMVLLGPVREELYPWYFIWPLTFISLIQPFSFIHIISIAFSFGLELRFAPYIYFRDWGGLTPRIKQIVSFAFPVAMFIYWVVNRLRHGKK